MEGLVYKSTGSWYLIRDEAGSFRNARIRGRLKIDEEISSSNPIAVGDRVLFDPEEGSENSAIIREIEKRKNYIVRISPHNRNQKHIVAANLDLAVLIATVASPRTSAGFIDRFLLTAEAYHIPAAIVVNKMDVLKPKQRARWEEWERIYTQAGYEIFPVVALDRASLLPLKSRLEGRTTLLSGHSGVGKTTLINQLIPERALRTAEVSSWSGKGQHTTTFAEMFDLPFDGRIIDTPGIKEFGLIDIERAELSHYFPEMRALINDCRFNNCLHENEPDCAVKLAVAEDRIDQERYISYLTILDSIGRKE